MGGGGNIGEESDNPVEINVTAMVDVIFCLCIFFMCSFHFKQVEGKIDAWLPREKGNQTGRPPDVVLEEIRVFMRWDASTGHVTRRVGNRAPVADDNELMSTIKALKADYDRAHKPDVSVLIDALPDVPWQDVIRLIDLVKAEHIASIEFAEPMEYAVRSQSR